MAENFDDIFQDADGQDSWNKESYTSRKKEERSAVYELADSTAAHVCSDGTAFRTYLDLQARFPRNSATNALLILAQLPQATQLRDFDSWKQKGISIQKGQRGISILVPGEEYRRRDGSVGRGYQVNKVFDISQTTARRLPEPELPLGRPLVAALIAHRPVPIELCAQMSGSPGGLGAVYDHESRQILVRPGMNAENLFRCLSQALAMAELDPGGKEYQFDRTAFQSYCVSYMLCRRYGVDVSDYGFDQVEQKLPSDPRSLRRELEQLRSAFENICQRMDRALELNRAPKTKGQER